MPVLSSASSLLRAAALIQTITPRGAAGEGTRQCRLPRGLRLAPLGLAQSGPIINWRREPAVARGPEPLGLPEDKFSAEAALVGRDFGLGEPAAVRTARRRDPMFGCGTILLTTGIIVGRSGNRAGSTSGST